MSTQGIKCKSAHHNGEVDSGEVTALYYIDDKVQVDDKGKMLSLAQIPRGTRQDSLEKIRMLSSEDGEIIGDPAQEWNVCMQTRFE